MKKEGKGFLLLFGVMVILSVLFSAVFGYFRQERESAITNFHKQMIYYKDKLDIVEHSSEPMNKKLLESEKIYRDVYGQYVVLEFLIGADAFKYLKGLKDERGEDIKDAFSKEDYFIWQKFNFGEAVKTIINNIKQEES